MNTPSKVGSSWWQVVEVFKLWLGLIIARPHTLHLGQSEHAGIRGNPFVLCLPHVVKVSGQSLPIFISMCTSKGSTVSMGHQNLCDKQAMRIHSAGWFKEFSCQIHLVSLDIQEHLYIGWESPRPSHTPCPSSLTGT